MVPHGEGALATSETVVGCRFNGRMPGRALLSREILDGQMGLSHESECRRVRLFVRF